MNMPGITCSEVISDALAEKMVVLRQKNGVERDMSYEIHSS